VKIAHVDHHARLIVATIVRPSGRPPRANRAPHAHAVSDGVFKLWEEIVPLYNLRRYFGFEAASEGIQEAAIVMEFSSIRAAFCVDYVDRIYRVEYHDISGGPAPVDAIVTDIEMPKLDGLHLTKRVKEHPALNNVPVIVCSSRVSPDNEKKCRAVGADMQITKPELGLFVTRLDQLLSPKTAS
jgi:CheY-like chemotaxis protein